MIRFPQKLKNIEGLNIPKLSGVWYRMVLYLENLYIRRVKIKEFPLNRDTREDCVIVSLTSFPDRIHTVQYSIKSLMLQTYKPDKIILWLAEEQFSDFKIPKELLKLKKHGLQIKLCPDIKSHKKYYYSMKLYEEEIIITYDDDIIYDSDSIEKLMKYYKKFPECIICNRAQYITSNLNGEIEKYEKWDVSSRNGAKKPSIKLMPSTGFGCLYPPNSLSKNVFNLKHSQKYAKSADDIWMKTMSLLIGTKVVKTSRFNRIGCTIYDSQHVKLSTINIDENMNNIVIKNMIRLFPSAFNNIWNIEKYKEE